MSGEEGATNIFELKARGRLRHMWGEEWKGLNWMEHWTDNGGTGAYIYLYNQHLYKNKKKCHVTPKMHQKNTHWVLFFVAFFYAVHIDFNGRCIFGALLESAPKMHAGLFRTRVWKGPIAVWHYLLLVPKKRMVCFYYSWFICYCQTLNIVYSNHLRKVCLNKRVSSAGRLYATWGVVYVPFADLFLSVRLIYFCGSDLF